MILIYQILGGRKEFMVTQYDDEGKRQKAEKRAKKWLKLLKKGNFGPIMNAVDPIFNPVAFKAACQAKTADLTDEEVVWLEAYLKQCQKAVYDPIPEAASTGW
jgi:hypothetical protein